MQELRGDCDRHEEFSNQMTLNQSVQSSIYSSTLFSDELLFHLSEIVNLHYGRFWMSENIHCSEWSKGNSLLWHP
jgi:hypothetical protein